MPASTPIVPPKLDADIPDQPLLSKSDRADISVSISMSCLLLAASIFMIWAYHEFFGFQILGESPDHWQWLGGLVGVVAVLIRLAVIGLFALPYIICSITGMRMSRRVARKSKGLISVVGWILVVCHVTMLLPMAVLLFGFWR